MGTGLDTDNPFRWSSEDDLSKRVIDVQLVTPTPTPEVDERLTAGTETTIHGQEVVGLLSLHEPGDRDLEGWEDGERSQLFIPYIELSTSKSIEDTICSFDWPQGCAYWIAIAYCESTLGTDPWAYDVRNPYTGLFQVWSGHGYGFAWLTDDANNTLAAWELSHEGTRTSPWPYCQR